MNADQSYELGKLYCDRGDYAEALPHLYKAAEEFLAVKNYDQYFKSIQNVLRIYAEREEFDQLSALKDRLHDVVMKENIEISSRAFYVFGIAALYKGQVDTSLEYFKLSLEASLKHNNKEDTCYAILGISICLRHHKRYDEALKEIYNLNIFLQFIDNLDLKAGVLSANAMILMDLKKYDQALEVLWQAYDLTKQTKQFSVISGVLTNIAACLCETGKKETAKVYFELASKNALPINSKKIFKIIESYSHLYKSTQADDFDLSFDFNNHQIIEKKLGRIDFKNQFILLDLLKLFTSKQGEVFSKEFLVEEVWKQTYNPEIHDNKIYVTIKRLRKLIEPDFDHPKYIFRSKNGYFLNKTVKVNNFLVSHRGEI
jgi:tetratricopeptide (TPR) repeat protein